jgi:hypothetical protein
MIDQNRIVAASGALVQPPVRLDPSGVTRAGRARREMRCDHASVEQGRARPIAALDSPSVYA